MHTEEADYLAVYLINTSPLKLYKHAKFNYAVCPQPLVGMGEDFKSILIAIKKLSSQCWKAKILSIWCLR